ncbi:MAG: hypothetical protein C5B54_01265 [Acidobacteria bacterium]|nr:MAG: hypothetical protein C5B54_01265 [Acidobacteriota bacterium]
MKVHRIIIRWSSIMKQAGLILFFLLCYLPTLSAQSAKSPAEVQAFIYVVDLREIDGAKQDFFADIVVRLRWKDPKLAGQGKHFLPADAAWNPNIQIVNRVSVQATLPEVLEVDESGNVIYRQRFIGQFSSPLNLREFPFDHQTISIILVALAKTPEEVKFVRDSAEESGIGSKLSITDWKIDSYEVKMQPFRATPGGRSLAGFVFELNLTRYFLFFLVQIIIPVGLIVAMSWIVFWLDIQETGPRVSLSVTSMLTLVAYRLLTASFLPRLPFLTRMDYFVFSSTSLVFLSLLSVVWIARSTKKKEPFAAALNLHSRWIFPVLFLFMLMFAFWF